MLPDDALETVNEPAATPSDPSDESAPGEVVPTTNVTALPWIVSAPGWTDASDFRYRGGAAIVGAANATLALDNNADTALAFEGGGNGVDVGGWFVFDTGVCVETYGIRVRATGAVGDVKQFQLLGARSLDVSSCSWLSVSHVCLHV